MIPECRGRSETEILPQVSHNQNQRSKFLFFVVDFDNAYVVDIVEFKVKTTFENVVLNDMMICLI